MQGSPGAKAVGATSHNMGSAPAVALLWVTVAWRSQPGWPPSTPLGPAESLFKESYYQLMKTALKEDGILCCQGEHGHSGMRGGPAASLARLTPGLPHR